MKILKTQLLLLVLIILAPLGAIRAQVFCEALKATTLPAPGDYGSSGTNVVARHSIAHPDSSVPSPVSVFLPGNATAQNRVGVVFFAHGFGGNRHEYYEALLNQLASNGYAVVFAPYATVAGTNGKRYEQLWTGFKIAVEQHGDVLDTSRVGFAGHSYGGGAVPEMARRAVAAGWGGNGLFLFPMAPWYAWGNGFNQIPANAKMVVQLYWDDGTNEHLIAQRDVWEKLPQITERKWQVVRASGCRCTLSAAHDIPVTNRIDQANGSSKLNAHDVWAVWRRLHALTDYTFNNKQAARSVAFGTNNELGRWRGCSMRRVTPLEAYDAPVINTESSPTFRYASKCFFADRGVSCP